MSIRSTFTREVARCEALLEKNNVKWEDRFKQYSKQCKKWSDALTEAKQKISKILADKSRLKKELVELKNGITERDVLLAASQQQTDRLYDNFEEYSRRELEEIAPAIHEIHSYVAEITEIKNMNRNLLNHNQDLVSQLELQSEGFNQRVSELVCENEKLHRLITDYRKMSDGARDEERHLKREQLSKLVDEAASKFQRLNEKRMDDQGYRKRAAKLHDDFVKFVAELRV